jgi:hypothetical protein
MAGMLSLNSGVFFLKLSKFQKYQISYLTFSYFKMCVSKLHLCYIGKSFMLQALYYVCLAFGGDLH